MFNLGQVGDVRASDPVVCTASLRRRGEQSPLPVIHEENEEALRRGASRAEEQREEVCPTLLGRAPFMPGAAKTPEVFLAAQAAAKKARLCAEDELRRGKRIGFKRI